MALDTNSLIYFFERHPVHHPSLRPVFLMAALGRISAVVSMISLTEVLTLPLRAGDMALVDRYRSGLVGASDIQLMPVNAAIAQRAAAVRAEFGWRTPDAIIAATAIESGCQCLVTNDGRFKGLPGVRALYLNDFAS